MEKKKLEIKHFKVKKLPSLPDANSVYYILDQNLNVVRGYITDLSGVPIKFIDLTSAGVENLTGTGVTGTAQNPRVDIATFVSSQTGNLISLSTNDGKLVVKPITSPDSSISITTTPTELQIELSDSISNTINSAMQSGDNISELVNDAGYLTEADVDGANLTYVSSPTNGIVQSSTGTDAIIPLADNVNAGLISAAEKANITSAVQPTDLSEVAFSGDYEDLSNIPTEFIPTPHTHNISDISGNKVGFNNSLTDGDFLFVGDITQYTNEQAQDAVGNILVDSDTIDLTYNDAANTIAADVKLNSIDSTHLANNINVSEFINDSGVVGITAKDALNTLNSEKEDKFNKATDFTTVNNTLYPSIQAAKTYSDTKQPLEDQRLSTTEDVSFNSVNITNSASINNLSVAVNSVHSDGTIVLREGITGEYGTASQETLQNIIGIGGDFASDPSILLFQGDSMTAGVPPADPYPDSIVTANVFDKINNGVGSKTIATIRTQAPTLDDVLYRFAARENIYILWAGTNDLYNTYDVDTTFKNLEATCRERQKKGFKVIVLTTVPRCGFASDGITTMASLILDYNTLIRQRWSTFADNIADVASDVTINSVNPCVDTTYYNGDGIHLTNTGNALLLPYVQNAINQLSKQTTFQDVVVKGRLLEPITIEKALGTSETAITIRNINALNGNLEKIDFRAWATGIGDSSAASIEVVSNGASIGQSVLNIKVAENGFASSTILSMDGVTKNSTFSGALAATNYTGGATLSAGSTSTTPTTGNGVANKDYVDSKKNEAGQIKVNYTGLTTTNFTAEAIKTLNINAATPAIVSSPTTTYPKSTPNNYGGFFDATRGSSPTGRLIENPVNGQVHTWRVQIGYSNKASGSNGALDVILSNPVSGFQYIMPFTLPSGRTSGTLNLNAITIADGASIPSPNGYILQAVTSFTDANLTLEILSITRISQAVEII